MFARRIALPLAALAIAAAVPARVAGQGGAQPAPAASADTTRPRFMLVVHGGAGTLGRAEMTPEREARYRESMTRAIRAGYDVLDRNGSALDAVVAVVRTLEDDTLFNAGKGAVFTNAGTNELDASIMDGRTLAAGAVAGVKHIRNPILLARLVMEKSPHVMMVGEGAEAFARSQGMTMVPQSYFWTKHRWDALQKARKEERISGPAGSMSSLAPAEGRYGTVGAVALDAQGNLAAATSTGGMTNKRWGRVGDAPIIGAGTYASNESCAVSATGSGEYFIRNTVAHDICARMMYRGIPLAQAADEVVMQRLVSQGGDGGVIAVDRRGNIAMPFNSEGMYRGFVGPDGEIVVKIFR
jgi:beta-aspartyl-peptidase (threonine type)